MAEIYRLPAVSPTMETGTLVAWRLEVGDAFTAGTVLAEVGTDKATMEAEVFDDGVLLARLVEEDAEIPVDAPIAVFGAEGEDATSLIEEAKAELAQLMAGGEPSPEERPEPKTPDATPAAPPPEAAPAAPPAKASAERHWQGQALPPVFLEPPGAFVASTPAAATRGPVRASPAARKAAQERGVDLAGVSGTGPHGRVLRSDVESAPVAAPSPASSSSSAPADQTLKLSPMRKTIARRLTEVHTSTPSFTLQVELDMTGMVRLRERLKATFPDDRISYNDLFLAAVGRALRAFPEANRGWSDNAMTQFGGVHVGMAVAIDAGLITPVIRDCDRKSVREIATESRALVRKARDGQLLPEDYQGNTFTVSNLGMFGIQRFTAILNPPASGILAVGALEQRPVVTPEGQLAVGWRMDVTMTCDHRVIDGAVGARFLQMLRTFVEEPGAMVA